MTYGEGSPRELWEKECRLIKKEEHDLDEYRKIEKNRDIPKKQKDFLLEDITKWLMQQ